MDASCVSVTDGLTEPKMRNKKMILIALSFGFFQGIMPLIGYLAGSVFNEFISKFLPYISLILLGAIGGKMIFDGFKHDEEIICERNLGKKDVVIQAVATSIDALTVGLLFISISFGKALVSFGIIAVITFILSFLALMLGKRFGEKLGKKGYFVGGIILILIGLKIFIEYLVTII